MIQKTQTLTIIILVFLIWTSYGHALNEDTHKAINENIANRTINIFSLNDFLIKNLGLNAGVKEPLYGYSGIYNQYVTQRIENWLGEGGVLEDRPGAWYDYVLRKPTRSINHFHNPLKPAEDWDYAGLNDVVIDISYTGQSQVLWAQNPDQNIGGKWSWQDARKYFYIALTGKDFDGNTIATTKIDKEKYFANTFRAIGQLMHLVQDASVPEHVRNDIHILPAYEAQVEKFRTRKAKYDFIWDSLLANPIIFDKSILTIPSTNPSATVPISRIIDTDRYTGGNPDITKTILVDHQPALQSVGIAEYTNVNFLSKDTMFESSTLHNFPFPRIIDTVLWKDTNKRTYIKKAVNGDVVEHLAVKSWLFDYRRKYFPQYDQKMPLSLDLECYKEYASLLIPRAVGYSAGLLDYFFRGNIEISLPSSGAYAQTDNPSIGFTQIKLLARNTTPNNEQMNNGTIELIVGYRRAIDDPFLNYPEDYPFQAENEITYIVVPEANGIRSIPNDSYVELTFDLSSKPIPLFAINVFIRLIYHGQLGLEDGAVAVGFKDISEPTPIDLFNDMDQICLNGRMYEAGSVEAIQQVDTNGDGIPEWDIYPHDLKDIYLRVSPINNPGYASPAEYDFIIPYLSAGEFKRAFYILADYNFIYSSYESWVNTDPDDLWIIQHPTTAIYTGVAIKNQVEYEEDPDVCAPMEAPCHIWWYPTFIEYRGANIWWGSAIMYINNAYPQNSECSCYQGILRNCMSGVQTTYTMSVDNLTHEYQLKNNNLSQRLKFQMQPLAERQRRHE
ncbi:MAG: hypothetical protein HXY53_10050 [Nitrospirae bacterium]|nr:hypothetical protein [Nitrospirota bacterium]